ncbi:hypothetical protein Tco_0344919, partial [Tanacetum coccineum]
MSSSSSIPPTECKCRLPLMMLTSWTRENLARRFGVFPNKYVLGLMVQYGISKYLIRRIEGLGWIRCIHLHAYGVSKSAVSEIPSDESKVHIEVLSVLWGNRLPIPDGSLPLSRYKGLKMKQN